MGCGTCAPKKTKKASASKCGTKKTKKTAKAKSKK
jgi:hypothetical protein